MQRNKLVIPRSDLEFGYVLRICGKLSLESRGEIQFFGIWIITCGV